MKILADGLIGLSFFAVILAIVGAVLGDFWLASTQWLLVAAVLSIWSVYVKMRE